MERRWATPTTALGIDWLEIIVPDTETWARNVSNRMVTTLPTSELRRQHFHEDARLHWAVELGYTHSGGSLPTAPPHDFGVFLERFDIGNEAGAPCPE